MPLNRGRTLPSKWDDAERWIKSPALEHGITRTMRGQHQKKPKSKSGPLGNSGGAGALEPGDASNFADTSPFPGALMVQYCAGIPGGLRLLRSDHSSRGFSDALPNSGSKGEHGSSEDARSKPCSRVSRRDVGTQMSPRSSPCSSPKGRPPPPISSSSSSLLWMQEDPMRSERLTDFEIRDVEVDGRATIIQWSRQKEERDSRKSTPLLAHYLYQREDAKISAWEKLQKAKAEAALRELEAKLEKKRSSSMEKILRKLRAAEIKAQEMRSSISEAQKARNPRMHHKSASVTESVQKIVLRGCFNCHAF